MKLEILKSEFNIEDSNISKVLKLYILKEIQSAKSSGNDVDEEEIRMDIYKLQILEWKDKLIFHGGCLGCLTPMHETIASCLSCEYCRGLGSGFEDKSEIYKDV